RRPRATDPPGPRAAGGVGGSGEAGQRQRPARRRRGVRLPVSDRARWDRWTYRTPCAPLRDRAGAPAKGRAVTRRDRPSAGVRRGRPFAWGAAWLPAAVIEPLIRPP